jgi:hypothetical protein
MVLKFDEEQVIKIGQGISDEDFMEKIGQDNYK